MNKFILFSFLIFIPYFLISQEVYEESPNNIQAKAEAIFYVNLNMFLEGPFQDGQMLTDLNKAKIIPLNQPFNAPPWNYNGIESVESMPNGNVVDWVYVELRNGLSPEEATSENTFGKQAAFLLNSGKVVSIDGASSLMFDTTYTWCMYVVVWHRNHLGMLSAEHLINTGNGIYSYDFSIDSSQVYGGALNTIELMPEVWGLPSGDVNCDGEINLIDKGIWETNAGKFGYSSADLNLNRQVDNKDKLNFWLKNDTLNCHVPD